MGSSIQAVGGGASSYSYADPTALNEFLAWSFDLGMSSQTQTPAAATIYLCKIPIPKSITVANMTVRLATAGTNYTNAQLGLYSSAGVLLGATAVQASAGTNGFGAQGAIALSSPVPISGGPTTYVYGAFHAGTNGATAIILGQCVSNSSAIFNIGVSGAATRRAMTVSGHATDPLATIGNLTLSGSSAHAGLWFGLS